MGGALIQGIVEGNWHRKRRCRFRMCSCFCCVFRQAAVLAKRHPVRTKAAHHGRWRGLTASHCSSLASRLAYNDPRSRYFSRVAYYKDIIEGIDAFPHGERLRPFLVSTAVCKGCDIVRVNLIACSSSTSSTSSALS